MSKLKLLFSSLFISLGFISFSYGQAPGITNPTFTILNGSTNTYNGITTSFDPYANFTSDTYLSKVFFYNYNTSNPFNSATFWHDGKLYIVSRGLSSNTLKWQGYAYLCKVESIVTNQFCRTYNNEGNPSLTEYYTEQYSNPDYFQFYGYNQPHIGCFVYESLGEKLCFGVQQDNSNGIDTTTQLFDTVPTGYDDPRFAELAGDSYWSPSGGSDDIPIYSDVVLIDPSLTYKTNSGVYKAFLDRGYSPGLCYGDFSTGDLVLDDTGSYVNQSAIFDQFFATDCDDSEGYCGASVFDYYNYIGSNLSILSWLQSRYSLFKYTYEKYNISPYSGYQKGTWRIMFKVYQSNFNENFNWIDYNTFCNMTVNGFDDNSLFTGEVSSGMEDWIEFQDSKLQAILSGSADNRTGDITFENGFNQLYTRIKSLRVLVDNDLVGVLPNYIILGFLLFVLLYGLKR